MFGGLLHLLPCFPAFYPNFFPSSSQLLPQVPPNHRPQQGSNAAWLDDLHKDPSLLDDEEDGDNGGVGEDGVVGGLLGPVVLP